MPNFEHSSKSIRMESYKITLQSVDGLSTHSGRPDILLISETHFTNRSYRKIPSYKVYSYQIKYTVKRYMLQSFMGVYLQATSSVVESRREISMKMYLYLFNAAKHSYGRARVINPQGSNPLEPTQRLHVQILATGELTYWTTHESRRSDVLDFFSTKGINQESFSV